MIDDILLQVNKPARYIGREWNVSKKGFDSACVKFALCFPDLYEIGMSNLGLRIIYGLLNNIPDVVCERFFSCATDMEGALRKRGMEIYSLESQKKLKEFDLIGFSLAHELCYTNVLNILGLGRVPLKSSERDYTYPLVIGGGPSTLNPEPMHDFFDLFVIGEAEEAILEIIGVYREYKDKFKASKISKEELLIMFSRIEGAYVPSLYEAIYNPEGQMQEFKAKFEGAPLKIKKRFIRDLDSAYFPLDWLIPYSQIIHDRITLEIMRGCPNRCRFCQAKAQYFPFRQRKIENILDLAKESYRRTGYEEISLCGLSVSEFSGIEGLLESLIDLFKEKAVSISLPSIKPKAIAANLSSLIATIKKTGLTFAPEAGTERLREVLNKDFNIQDFLTVLQRAYNSGYQNIKLYFMIGLPTERIEDLDSIIGMARSALGLQEKARRSPGFKMKRPAHINISINTLIPKPHTPFQWLKMENIDEIRHKQAYLRDKIRGSRLRLSLRSPYMSIIESILSRGDRRLSEVILYAFNRGARFDAWDNYFIFDHWVDAFRDSHLNPDFYLQEKPKDGFLPWDFLDVGVSKDSLVAESKKLVA